MVTKEPCKKTSTFAVSLMILYVPSYLHTHHMGSPEEGVGSPRTEVMGDREPPLSQSSAKTASALSL